MTVNISREGKKNPRSPLLLLQETNLVSVRVNSRFSSDINFIHRSVYKCRSLSPSSSCRPPLLGVHTFVPYICISISVLQIRSFIDSVGT